MNTWERVNVSSLAIGLAFLLVLLGSYIPRADAAQQPITSDGISTAPAIAVPAAAILPPLDAPTIATEPAPAPAAEPPVTCYEDMPCWDCATMGNRICGPLVTAPPVVTCETQGMLTAEDGSCVPASFYAAPEPIEIPQPLYPCATDEVGPEIPACYWDAQLMGNGLGLSYVWTGQHIIYS